MLRTAIYIRKSSEDETEKQANSLERQKQDIEAYIKRQNEANKDQLDAQLVFDATKDLYQDDASAKKVGNRPNFEKMMAKLTKGRYDVLLACEPSRLSRNAIDTGRIVQLLEEAQLRQVRTLDKTFTNSPTDKFTLALFLSVAKYENDQRAANTRSGIQAAKRKGVTTGKAPIGYLNVGIKKGESKVDRDPETWDKLRALWDLVLGGKTVAEVSRYGEQLGITVTAKGGVRRKVARETYRNMFRSRYYAGMVEAEQGGGGEKQWVPGQHEAMVTPEEFDRVQQVLKYNGYSSAPIIQTRQNEELAHIIDKLAVSAVGRPYGSISAAEAMQLPHLVYDEKDTYSCSKCASRFSAKRLHTQCPKCGAPVTEKTKRYQSRYYQFTTDGRNKAGGAIVADDLEAYVSTQMERLRIPENTYKVLRGMMMEMWEENKAELAKRDKANKARLDRLDDEVGKLMAESFEADEHRKESIQIRLQRINEEKDGLRTQQGDLDQDRSEQLELAWVRMNMLKELHQVFAANGSIMFETRKEVLLAVCSNIVCYSKKDFEILWKEPFGDFFRLFDKQSPDSGMPIGACELLVGSPDWDRTSDLSVNSRLLYR